MENEYLHKAVGTPLTQCLAELVTVRPEDPIEWIAHWLYRYVDNEAYFYNKAVYLKSLDATKNELERETAQRRARRMEAYEQWEELREKVVKTRPRRDTQNGKNAHQRNLSLQESQQQQQQHQHQQQQEQHHQQQQHQQQHHHHQQQQREEEEEGDEGEEYKKEGVYQETKAKKGEHQHNHHHHHQQQQQQQQQKQRRQSAGSFGSSTSSRKSGKQQMHKDKATIAAHSGSKQKSRGRMRSSSLSSCTANWQLARNNLGLICDHPLLGAMTRRPFSTPESPEEWQQKGYLEQSLYDHELYSVNMTSGRRRRRRRRTSSTETSDNGATTFRRNDSPRTTDEDTSSSSSR